MSKQSVIDDLCRCIEQANERAERLAKRVYALENNFRTCQLTDYQKTICGSRFGHRLSIIVDFPEGYTFKCLDCGLQYAAYDKDTIYKKSFTSREQKIIDNLESQEK